MDDNSIQAGVRIGRASAGGSDGLAEVLAGARVYDLAQPLEAATPALAHHAPFRMALLRRHGDVVRQGGLSGANELLSLGGHSGTHIDALCHMAVGGVMHGGVDAASATAEGRFRSLGVETIAPILCRGVLLDVPGVLGVSSLEPGRPVRAADLERAARVAGVEIGRGDAVLVRTGWPVGRLDDAESFLGLESGVPGPDATAAAWLVERGVRVTGADTLAYEWLAPGAGVRSLPVHALLLVEWGVPIIELMDLEELARDGVSTFAFVAAPLKITGATGSPMRPLGLVAT
jgi:kynurenine formamidase